MRTLNIWHGFLIIGSILCGSLFVSCATLLVSSPPEQMGYVLTVASNEALIDLDRHNGIVPGIRFLVVQREGNSHRLRRLGEIKVTTVESKLSRCEIVNSSEAFHEGALVYRYRQGMDVTDGWEQPPLQVRGPITKSGTLAWDEVWSGEITLAGDVVVPHNITLTIQPETQIIVLPSTDAENGGENPNQCELIINGRLEAKGTAERPIRFIATRSRGGNRKSTWRGIRILSPDPQGSIIVWTHIEYAYRGIDVQNTKSVIIRENRIQNCEQFLIHCERSNVVIAENDCHNAHLGIVCASCTATLEKNHISQTDVGIRSVTSEITIRENNISRNNNAIESRQDTTLKIERNTIDSNLWVGMMLYGSATITGNTITRNGSAGEAHFRRTGEVGGDGVMIFERGSVILTRNTITQNARHGVYCAPRSQPNLGDLSNRDPNDDGGNIFHSNGRGNLETESPYPINAEGNFWQVTTSEAIADTINIRTSKHVLAAVDFEPFRLSRVGHQLSTSSEPTLDLTRPRSSFTVKLELDSKYPTWQSGGQRIPIHEGDRLTFHADGTIDFAISLTGGDYEPNGRNDVTTDKRSLAPKLTQFGLVGWIGWLGEPFFIGTGTVMTAPTGGLLHFGINDWNFPDNGGTFRVTVQVNGR